MPSNDEKLSNFDILNKGFQWVLSALMAVIAWQGATVLDSLSDHERRITTIEASRYTAQDAVADQRMFLRDVNAGIKDLKAETALQFQRLRERLDERIKREE